ncbi:MAG: hypothetical protein E7299_07040 [Lachnospiraceae bacterium]|nr:hypothetical protein [Lachnospiraceae bacterium]
MTTNVNETLKELLLGIFVWGVLGQAVPIWFIKDKGNYSIGLWIGVLLAAACAIHMYKTLERALDLDEKGAQKTSVTGSAIRYMVILLVMGILMITEFGNPLAAFLGVMGLKAAAYMQPFIHRLFKKRSE